MSAAVSLPLDTPARPPIKCAGGKTKLLPEIFARIPKKFGTYYEPFVGGGALFFALRSSLGMSRRYVLGDMNQNLVITYREIRDRPHDLIRRLRGMKNTKKFFLAVRAIDLESMHEATPGRDSARAARLIYLNKTCFNGLHRVNRAGQFNVPFGGYPNPKICDEENILACSRALKKVALYNQTFSETVADATEGDFAYFDPPYFPLSLTSNFTAYDLAGFGWSHHVALHDTALALKKRGVHVMISNSASPRILELYKSSGAFKVDTIHAARSINASANGRGKIPELLIT